MSQMAFSSDSARFALALRHYDVTQMQPHAPGYFLYVAVAKLLCLIWNDATASLVAVSVISSGVAAALTFSLASSMYGRMVGVASTLLLLTSPVLAPLIDITVPCVSFMLHNGLALQYNAAGSFL